ncbi:oxidoreductase [Aureimonas sp. AU20]|uniref:oxidoreductase n=2 Tax=Aureimonas sp. AU20 TaxID=1349819 RepID=UPI0012E3534C|nr:oxidoreductase [Aureimonas sp. AU20]
MFLEFRMLSRRDVVLAFAVLPFVFWRPLRAAAADTMLRVIGMVGDDVEDGRVEYDAAALDALPQTRFATTTPWHDTPVEFAGVSARDLFQAVGAHGENLQLIALNDYVVEAKVSDIIAGDGLFATRQNGVPMPVSDKGPIFLVFPFDQRPETQHQAYYSRAVWQLAEIVVTP